MLLATPYQITPQQRRHQNVTTFGNVMATCTARHCSKCQFRIHTFFALIIIGVKSFRKLVCCSLICFNTTPEYAPNKLLVFCKIFYSYKCVGGGGHASNMKSLLQFQQLPKIKPITTYSRVVRALLGH